VYPRVHVLCERQKKTEVESCKAWVILRGIRYEKVFQSHGKRKKSLVRDCKMGLRGPWFGPKGRLWEIRKRIAKQLAGGFFGRPVKRVQERMGETIRSFGAPGENFGGGD